MVAFILLLAEQGPPGSCASRLAVTLRRSDRIYILLIASDVMMPNTGPQSNILQEVLSGQMAAFISLLMMPPGYCVSRMLVELRRSGQRLLAVGSMGRQASSDRTVAFTLLLLVLPEFCASLLMVTLSRSGR